MTIKNLGIIGGGQLGSMMSSAAKKLDIKKETNMNVIKFFIYLIAHEQLLVYR